MTDKLQEGIKDNSEKISKSDLLTDEIFAENLDNLVNEIIRIGREDPPSFRTDDPVNMKLHKAKHHLANFYNSLIKSNRSANDGIKSAKDYEKRYLVVKFKESLMAFGFRVATTLAIGFSIMLVYWVASCLNIPMPLLRVPM